MAKRSRQPQSPVGSSTLIEHRLPKFSRNAGKNVNLDTVLMKVAEALLKGEVPQAFEVQRRPPQRGGPDYEQILQLLRKADNFPIVEPPPVRQPSDDLETKAAKIKKLLEQCAELAGDDQSLLDFALAQPFLKNAAGPPKLFVPARQRAKESPVGSPRDQILESYKPPSGSYLRLDDLARINPRLYNSYNVAASRNPELKVDGLISKPEFFALAVGRLIALGYSAELLLSIGSSLQRQKPKSKARPRK